MKLPHHLTELNSDLKMSHRVVVIHHERRDERVEAVLCRIVIEAIPENQLCPLGCERVETIGTTCGDEVDLVVAISMLKAMLALEAIVFGVARFASPTHGFPGYRVTEVTLPLFQNCQFSAAN